MKSWLSVKSFLVLSLLLSCLTAGAVTNAPPAGLPKWEIGLFGGAARIPHYRGADEYKWYAFPLPYFVYRGEIVQADKEGIRGLFYKGKWLETDFSLSGNPPVRDGHGVREGMPDLDPLVEIGPVARLYLFRGKTVKSIYGEAALRAVESIDMDTFEPRYEGLHATLSLVLAGYVPRPGSPWRLGMKAGVDFADDNYNGYFYSVEEQYVRPGRPAYQSRGGYDGCSISGWVSRKLSEDLTVSLYGRVDNVEGAVYEDSPLVRRDSNFTIGAALIWKIIESETRVRFKP